MLRPGIYDWGLVGIVDIGLAFCFWLVSYSLYIGSMAGVREVFSDTHVRRFDFSNSLSTLLTSSYSHESIIIIKGPSKEPPQIRSNQPRYNNLSVAYLLLPKLFHVPGPPIP